MSRRLSTATLSILLLGTYTPAQAQSDTPTPTNENDNPINDQGSNYNYRSNIKRDACCAPTSVRRARRAAHRGPAGLGALALWPRKGAA